MALHDGTAGRMTVAPATDTPARGGVTVAARPARPADPGQVPLRPPVAAPGPWRLTGRPALYLLASLTVALLAASAAPTPLYAIYQAHWHFTPITTTLVFGVYAVAVLASLLTLGKLSDHVGRRPVLLSALAVQAVSLLVFATAGGVPELLIARVIQGLATGAALGAIGAGLLDVDRVRGTFANSVAPGIGSGSGVLLSALVVR
jgi:MFS family permease